MAAGGGDDGEPRAVGDDGAGVHHVDPVGQSAVGAGRHRHHLRHRYALAGQRGLVDAEAERLDHPGVGGHVVAGLEDEHIAGHDGGGGQDHLRSVAPDERPGRGRALGGND